MKKLSIKMAVLIPVLAVLVVGVALMVAVVGSVGSSSQQALVDRLINARVNESTNDFTTINERGYAIINTIAMIVEHIREHSNDPRHETVDILEEILKRETDLQGTWTIWEPNAFDGKDAQYVNFNEHHDETGHFVPYIYFEDGKITTSAMQLHNDPVDGLFYLGAKYSEKPYVTDPYIYPIDGVPTVLYSIAIPMFDNGKFAGAVGADFSLGTVASIFSNASILDDGYFFVLSPSGSVAVHSNPDLLMQSYRDTWLGAYSTEVEKLLANGGYFSKAVYSDVAQKNMLLLAQGVTIGDTGRYWAIAGLVPESTATADSTRLTLIVVVVGVALVILVGLTSWLFVNNSLRQLPRLTKTAERIAAGELNHINLSNNAGATKNEMTLLEHAFAEVVIIINQLVKSLCDISTVLNVDGDIDARVDVTPFKGAYKEVAEEINNVIDGVINDSKTILGSLEDFGNGKFDVDVPKLPGKKVLINQAIDTMSQDLKALNYDISGLIADAMEGKLSSRADTSKYNGDWVVLISNLNKLLETIVAPITETATVLRYVSEGNFEHQVEGHYKGDFKLMKDSVNTTVLQVAGYINEISAVLTGIAENNLDQAVTREYVGSYSAIKESLNNIIKMLNTVIGDFNSASVQVATSAKYISESSMSLAEGAGVQAASVQELNATIETISDSAANNAGNAKEAETLSRSAKVNAGKGDEDMKRMLTAMEEIKGASSQITKIIKVIDDIAFQTNLLALNAAVEAARAGSHGKGFAVVADEVRTLAGRSQVAAKETAQLIEQTVLKVNEGEEIAEQAAEALQVIVDDVGKVSDIISRIADASQSQAEAVKQVTVGLTQITDVVQENSATSQESAASAEELTSQSEVLQDMTSVFKLKRK